MVNLLAFFLQVVSIPTCQTPVAHKLPALFSPQISCYSFISSPQPYLIERHITPRQQPNENRTLDRFATRKNLIFLSK